MNYTHKDPQRQLQGWKNKTAGKRFEDRLSRSFDYYREKGIACIEKTPEPFKIINSLGGGRFECVITKKAQPDYKGTVKGGRSYLFEAKYTATDRIEKKAVTDAQTEYMDEQTALGAKCFVVVGFSSQKVYKVPWESWQSMKETYGRKYMREDEMTRFKVKVTISELLILI